MRREGRSLLDDDEEECSFSFSFSVWTPKSQWESCSSGKRGANVVRGDRPNVGMLSLFMLLEWEGGVGIAKKERSFPDCSLLLLSNRSKIGRPLLTNESKRPNSCDNSDDDR